VAEATTLQGRYRLNHWLAAGAMGTVYEATDERLNRHVVVKVLKEGLSQDASFVERFRREARAVAALSHPNIASVYDSGEDAGRHFMVMELVKGRDLGRIINEDGRSRLIVPPTSPPRCATRLRTRTPRTSFIATSSRPT